MSPISSFLRFVRQPTATSSAHGSSQALAQTPFKVHPGFGLCETISRRMSHCRKILVQRFLGKNESCYSQTLDKQAKPRSSMEYDMPKAIRWLSTLLLSPVSVLAELKLVAKVENQTPLVSTDKACELLKWNSKKTMFPLRALCTFLPSQRWTLSQAPRGRGAFWKKVQQWQGHASDALSTHRDVYCG